MIIIEALNRNSYPLKEYPISAVQFGQGNFLRAFADYFIDISNEKGVTDIGIGVVKPQPTGDLKAFQQQDNLYTVAIRGVDQGKLVDTKRIISSITKTVSPYTDFKDYLAMAREETLEFVFSNTTEAGIAFVKEDKLSDSPPSSFPGKLTQFLYERFNFFLGDGGKGLFIVPCELIDKNGDTLKEIVIQYITLWNLEPAFKDWVEEYITFTNTLVDRIVTGHPKGNKQELFTELGYKDELLTVAEPFALWVIEDKGELSLKFPLDKAGLPVLFTKDISPYRKRKVRILNGGHTAMVPAAFLAGKDIVRDCMEDKIIRCFLESAIKNEIIPTIQLPMEELTSFSKTVIERFENPFIDHALLDISLNSVSKWKTRVLPSFLDYYNKNQCIPKLLGFSLAALIKFYKSTEKDGNSLVGNRNNKAYYITDKAEVLDFFVMNSKGSLAELAKGVLENVSLWGRDLSEIPDFLKFVQKQLTNIELLGAEKAMEILLLSGD